MLADSLRQWLDAHADSLDEGPAHAHEVLPGWRSTACSAWACPWPRAGRAAAWAMRWRPLPAWPGIR